jgi:hypothetical protein
VLCGPLRIQFANLHYKVTASAVTDVYMRYSARPVNHRDFGCVRTSTARARQTMSALAGRETQACVSAVDSHLMRHT